MTAVSGDIWSGVFRIIDTHPDADALRAHGLGAIAARHWHVLGREVPASLASEQALQAALLLEAKEVATRVREVVAGPVLLVKGLDVAELYPDPSLRRVRDVDALVGDPEQSQRRLIARGFREVTGRGHAVDSSDVNLHQLCPLRAPGLWLPVEVHRFPHWPVWSRPPAFDELVAEAVPSVVVDGALTPRAEHHTLVLLAHAWAGQPFEQLSQLIDFSLMLAKCDRDDLRRVARRWKLDRLLQIGERTVRSVLDGETDDPLVIRVFASHLRGLSRPSPARAQLNRYGASAFATSAPDALSGAWRAASRRARTLRARAQ